MLKHTTQFNTVNLILYRTTLCFLAYNSNKNPYDSEAHLFASVTHIFYSTITSYYTKSRPNYNFRTNNTDTISKQARRDRHSMTYKLRKETILMLKQAITIP